MRWPIRTLTARSVSTLTPLQDWIDLSGYESIAAILINDDPTNNANLIVETSEDDDAVSKKPDNDIAYRVQVPPGKQGSVEVPRITRRFWRISSESDSPGFPSVPVRWMLSGARDQ